MGFRLLYSSSAGNAKADDRFLCRWIKQAVILPSQVATSKRGHQGGRAQGLGRCCDGLRPCLHRPPHQGLERQKTL